MCYYTKEELERMKAIIEEKKKIKEALKDIKPSDFEAKKEKEEKALTVKD
ncbi:hypothetical protein HRbin13_01080 [bacterium HR13]|nr:hypothetical protein HRbin13_01080 [bacterium HR13]